MGRGKSERGESIRGRERWRDEEKKCGDRERAIMSERARDRDEDKRTECVYVCARQRKKERERETDRGLEREGEIDR